MAAGGRAQWRRGEWNGRWQWEWRSCEGGGMEGGDIAAPAAGEPPGMEPPSVA